MIFVTGDVHMPLDRGKLEEKRFAQQNDMTKDDYLIICGDCAAVWDGGEHDMEAQQWLSERSFTTLYVDGNHENHDLLDAMPVEEWNGGQVHKVGEDIIHLMRGQVFSIQGKTFFTMGGAYSIDKPWRTEGVSWWARELPSEEEKQLALNNLAKHDNKVDFILTHTGPYKMIKQYYTRKQELEFNTFLDEVRESVEYEHWYFGHVHVDRDIDKKHTSLYNEIRQIV